MLPSKVDKSAEAKSKDSKHAQMEEYLQVMKPRTKKGPSWADHDALPQPSSSSTPATASKADAADMVGARQTRIEKHSADGVEDATEPDAAEAVSDMDWFKQRTKAVLNEPKAATERAFEQSEDEAEEGKPDDDGEVWTSSYGPCI